MGAISMAFAFVIMLRLFGFLTPINEWEEIRKGNIAVGILMAAAILAVAIVVAVAIAPGT